jgi:hypothetical protein
MRLLLEGNGSEYLRGLFMKWLLLGVVVAVHDDSISNNYYIPFTIDSTHPTHSAIRLLKSAQKGE